MELSYKPELPNENRPIYIIGAGGIVWDAHLPAYRKAGFKVAGITNRTRKRAENLANDFQIEKVYDTTSEMVKEAPANAVFDITLMPDQFVPTLELLPDGAAVLIQKPMGDFYEQTLKILEVTRRKKLKSAINCQLRYAPYVMAARNIIDKGLIGDLYDLEVRLTTHTPWEYFPNVLDHPRLEIQMHSIHYIDMIRSFLGNPKKIYAKTLRHPLKQVSFTRTTTIMDYHDSLRAVINTNHDHNFGSNNQESFIKWEGTKGAIKAKMGLLLDYPDGVPDKFEFCLQSEGSDAKWKTMELEGSWFPDAFVGTMSDLMRFAEGTIGELPTSTEDVKNTMAIIEAAFLSNNNGGMVPQYNI